MEKWSSRFAGFLLRSRWHAGATLAVIFALAWLLPPLAGLFFTLLGAVIVLIALQVGTRPSLEAALLAAAALALMTWSPAVSAAFMLAWLPAWIIGEVLRRSESLVAVSWAMLGLSLLVVFMAVYAVPSDAVNYWQGVLGDALKQVGATGQSAIPQDMLRELAGFFPGLLACLALAGWVISLFLGRYLQGVYLEQPQLVPGTGFRGWDLPLAFLVLLPLSMLLGWLASGNLAVLMQDLTLVLGFFFVFQGLAVVHAWVHVRHWPWQVLPAIYFMLILLAQTAILVSGLGIADKVLNLRQRMQGGS